MESHIKYLILLLVTYTCTAALTYYDDAIDNQIMMKKAMANKTKANMLNLPANATSIRKNITDNFSCKGRMYGYYADVENDCQIFHVCLPSQSASGRNTTYRWSFICPKETVFDQDVMVCARKRDSIDCKDSPMYYDRNLEIGKVTNKTHEQTDMQPNMNTMYANTQQSNKPYHVRDKPMTNRKEITEMYGANENQDDFERITEERSFNERPQKYARSKIGFRFKADVV